MFAILLGTANGLYNSQSVTLYMHFCTSVTDAKDTKFAFLC